MVPDRAFVDELYRFDPNLLVVWNYRVHRWQIRHWLERPAHYSRHYIPADLWRKRSFLIRTVCYRDEEFKDIGYHPLDNRTLYALKLSKALSVNPEATARMVDESNKKVEESWAADNKDIAREVAKGIWHHYREPTVDLGGKSRY